MTRLLRLARDTAGATMIEAALVLPLLLILTFGITEFGLALWQYNAAEKAMAEGARYVATRGPLVTGVKDCFVNTSEISGTRCSEIAGATGWSGTCGAGASGVTCDAAVMTAVKDRVRAIAPFVDPAKIQVELRGSNFGFVGRGAPVPVVTVRLVGQTYNFIAIDKLVGFGPVTMPGFDATTVAEDQNEGEWE